MDAIVSSAHAVVVGYLAAGTQENSRWGLGAYYA